MFDKIKNAFDTIWAIATGLLGVFTIALGIAQAKPPLILSRVLLWSWSIIIVYALINAYPIIKEIWNQSPTLRKQLKVIGMISLLLALLLGLTLFFG